MKVGIAGNGTIVPVFIESAREAGADIAAVCGREKSLSRLEELASRYALPRVYTDYDRMLEDAGIDTVYVAVSNHVHYEYAARAMRAKKHVILEKPFTANAAQARILREIADEERVFLFEAIMNQYNPIVKIMKKELDRIGEVRIAEMNFSQYSRRYDAFKAGEILPVFDPQMAGGALMDINMYNLYLCAALFGMPAAHTYEANIIRGIDTSGILNLDYGTFRAVLVGAKDCGAPGRVVIQGDKGYLYSEDKAGRIRSFTLVLNDGYTETFSLKEEHKSMYYELKEFDRMMREDAFAEMRERLDTSVAVMEILDSAREQAGIRTAFETEL